MPQYSRFNAIDQLLDVAGSVRQAGDRLLTDETGGLGSPVILNSGVLATITAFATPSLTLAGLTGQSAASVGTLISLRNAEKSGNNGVFRVLTNISAVSNTVSDVGGYFPDGNSGNLVWEQYSSGNGVTISAFAAGIVTGTGLAGMTANSVGNYIQVTGATGGNNGTFLITAYISATSVQWANASGAFPDANSPAIEYVERLAYSLNDDLDAERSDRTYIKGVNYDLPMPSYSRPTLTGVNVPASIANLAGKTLDAFARSVNRGQFNWAVERTYTDIYGIGALKHSDASNTTGVPCFDAAPWVGDYNTTFVGVVDALTGNELEVLAGPQQGQRIFGISRAGAISVSPNSVEIAWYSCANGGNIATSSTAYTWEQGVTTAKSGTTTVTVVPGVSPASALTGLTGGNFVAGDIGTFLTITGSSNPANNGTFVILSIQSGTAVTVSNAGAVAEGPTAGVTWLQKWIASVTVVAGANGSSALTGLTAGGFATPADVGKWITITGMSNGANNGTFVIISVQSATAVTIQNAGAVSEGPTASVNWAKWTMTQPTFVNLTYGFNERLDQLDQNAFRFPMVSGLTGDADLRQDIIDLQSTGGWADGTTNLATYLTNTGANFPFFTLPGGAGDTVVAALNALNQQIGNRTYSPLGVLTNGQTITASLQALNNAISAATVFRWITRLAVAAPANVAITLPGGQLYVLDGTNNGKGLMVFWRGVLRDPGTVVNGDDYAETSTSQITPYAKINQNDHINFVVI